MKLFGRYNTVVREPNGSQWIRWEAQDADGTVKGYETKPRRIQFGWTANKGQFIRLATHGCTEYSWKKSLTQIKYDG